VWVYYVLVWLIACSFLDADESPLQQHVHPEWRAEQWGPDSQQFTSRENVKSLFFFIIKAVLICHSRLIHFIISEIMKHFKTVYLYTTGDFSPYANWCRSKFSRNITFTNQYSLLSLHFFHSKRFILFPTMHYLLISNSLKQCFQQVDF